MSQLKRAMVIAVAVVLGSAVSPAAAGDVERGKQVAQTCLACHGLDGAGNAAGGFPRLDGLNGDYLANQLQAFKNGTRKNPIMQPFAAPLGEQEMADVSAYYAALKRITGASSPVTGQAAVLGEKLALRGDWDRYLPPCAACHGPGNQGVGEAFPALAGQHASYIESQLRAWRAGTRTNDPLNLMLAIAERMSDADIKAVAAYLSAQPTH